MRKKTAILALSAGLSVLTTIPALASGWQKNETGWWYGTNADNSTWYSNGWQWIDGNGDGIAECYYFDANGYMAENTVIDGSSVDGNGAWTVNGVVQTKQVSSQQNNKDLQRWIGTYVKTDDQNCWIEVYDANEGGITVEYQLCVGSMIAPNNEHRLAFKNGDTTKAYGAISPMDRGVGHMITAIDLPETYELMGDGNIKITFAYDDEEATRQETWTALNGVYKKTGTDVKTIAERQEEHRRNLEAAGYNEDGTLTEEGKMFDHDGDGRLNTDESAELLVKHTMDYLNSRQ